MASGRACGPLHLLDDWVTPTASPALVERDGRPARRCRTLDRCPLLGAPGRDDWSDWFAQFGGIAPARFVATFDDSERCIAGPQPKASASRSGE